jgi:hypothetical protein
VVHDECVQVQLLAHQDTGSQATTASRNRDFSAAVFDTMAFAQPFPLAAPQLKAHQPTFGPDLAVRLICPECRDPNPNIVEEFGSGDLVCGNCGLVLGDRIVDTRSEWRVSPYF